MAKTNCDGYLDEIQERMMDGDMLKAMLETTARRVMEEELALHLGAERHERTENRRGHRNGYKGRMLKTRVGELALQVPQVRGVEPYSPMLFAKWEHTERDPVARRVQHAGQPVQSLVVQLHLELAAPHSATSGYCRVNTPAM